MSMTSRRVTIYQGHCDYPGCNAIVTDDEYNIHNYGHASTDFHTPEDMVLSAECNGWMTCADNMESPLYCPEHWHLDDDYIKVSNDGKARAQ